MFAENELLLGPDHLRRIILVGISVLNQRGDVDPAFMTEGMFADYRFCLCNFDPGIGFHGPRKSLKSREIIPVDPALHPECDENLFERSVSAPFADPVYGRVKLECS